MIQRLRVIKGGIGIPEPVSGRTFISGSATDTRLMGVTGLELTWDVRRDSRIERLHQIFYLDCEEYGIESYTEGCGEAPLKIIEEHTRLCAALGGESVPINEREARFLIQSHMHINTKYNQPMPDGYEKFLFLTRPVQTLSGSEYKNLMQKISGTHYKANYVINHFLMRCVSGDPRGADWLTDSPGPDDEDTVTPDYRPDMSGCSLFMSSAPKTLCRNSIERTGDPDSHTFFCESLIEYNSRYQVVTSLIELNDSETRVLNAKKQSDFRITSAEAAMLVNRSEFITVYEVINFNEEFTDAFERFAAVFTETVYDSGRLYIHFNETNSHVGEPVYLINNDIHAAYYLTDYGQILVMGYSHQDVSDAEFRLYLSMMHYPLAISTRYEFREPVFYEFIRSDFADFNEFISFLGGEPDPGDEE